VSRFAPYHLPVPHVPHEVLYRATLFATHHFPRVTSSLQVLERINITAIQSGISSNNVVEPAQQNACLAPFRVSAPNRPTQPSRRSLPPDTPFYFIKLKQLRHHHQPSGHCRSPSPRAELPRVFSPPLPIMEPTKLISPSLTERHYSPSNDQTASRSTAAVDGERLVREMKVNWELQGCCDHD
jgi:hypothetical protein